MDEHVESMVRGHASFDLFLFWTNETKLNVWKLKDNLYLKKYWLGFNQMQLTSTYEVLGNKNSLAEKLCFTVGGLGKSNFF